MEAGLRNFNFHPLIPVSPPLLPTKDADRRERRIPAWGPLFIGLLYSTVADLNSTSYFHAISATYSLQPPADYHCSLKRPTYRAGLFGSSDRNSSWCSNPWRSLWSFKCQIAYATFYLSRNSSTLYWVRRQDDHSTSVYYWSKWPVFFIGNLQRACKKKF